MKTNATILKGSIIHGTLRNADIIPVFMVTLRDLNYREYMRILKKYPEYGDAVLIDGDNSAFWESETSTFMVEDIFDALNAEAPEGFYFGSHPGDGSDFGFWPVSLLD